MVKVFCAFRKFFPKYAVSKASRRELQLCFELNHFATKNLITYVSVLSGYFGSQV